jgi:hypothetical protein
MHVTRHVAYAVAAAFVAMIAIIFYLLGRESVHRRPRGQLAQATAPAPAAEPAPAPAPWSAPTSPPPASPTPTYTQPPLPAPPPLPPAMTAPAKRDSWSDDRAPPPITAPSGDAPAIRRYFDAIAAIQTVAAAGDATEVATQLLEAAARGDSSGLDGIVHAAEDGVARARALQPPPACAAYHQQLVAMLGESVAMIRSLKQAMASSDANALGAIAVTGNALKARAERLEADGRAIRIRAGI